MTLGHGARNARIGALAPPILTHLFSLATQLMAAPLELVTAALELVASPPEIGEQLSLSRGHPTATFSRAGAESAPWSNAGHRRVFRSVQGIGSPFGRSLTGIDGALQLALVHLELPSTLSLRASL